MKFDPKMLEALKTVDFCSEALEEQAERMEEEAACRTVAALLRRHGAPLVCPTVDGVLLCKNGTWAHGKDLPRALEALREKLEKRG